MLNRLWRNQVLIDLILIFLLAFALRLAFTFVVLPITIGSPSSDAIDPEGFGMRAMNILEDRGYNDTDVLARAIEVDAPTVPWTNGYRWVKAMTFTIRASCRPFIGISPGTAPALTHFLRQQGYIVEINKESHYYAYYFDQAEFVAEHKRPLLAQIEGTDRPLMRLGRWPDGARSALAVTGDIDALTLWDYGLRFVGR